jgi:hypothetical protein
MQVFVRRSSLTLAADETVRVMAFYDDGVAITPAMQRPELTLLSLAANAIRPTPTGMSALVAGWRESNREQIANGEAERRILEAFPDYAQRNASAELMGYLSTHGANASAWPREAQQRKAEIDRAWAYVEAVRRASNGMVARALPGDPTADSHWPTRITAYRSV